MQVSIPAASPLAASVSTGNATENASPSRRIWRRASPSRGFFVGWRSKTLPSSSPSSGRMTSGTASTGTVAQPRAAQAGLEQSYVMVKPDGVQRGLVGEIISRFEHKGFKLKALKLFQCPEELAKKHYEELKEKPFYPKLVKYIISGPVVCMVWEGPGVVASARKLIGATNPLAAEPGTIRGDLGIEVGRNVVHGSDSPANGDREIGLWFREDELCEWQQEMTPWLRE